MRTDQELIVQNIKAGTPGNRNSVTLMVPPDSVTSMMWSAFGVGCFLVVSGMKASRSTHPIDRDEKRPFPEV